MQWVCWCVRSAVTLGATRRPAGNDFVQIHHPRPTSQCFFPSNAMLESKDDMDHSSCIETYIRQVPVTYERRPYNPTPLEDKILKNAGMSAGYEEPGICLMHSSP